MDIDEAKRKNALARGASEAIDPADGDAVKAFVKRTGGAVAALDFVGAPATWATGTAVVRRGGSFVIVGLFGGAVTLPIATVPMRAMAITGSYVGRLDEAQELIALLKSGKVDAPLIVDRPLAAASQSLNELREGKVLGRVVLAP
jgi:D-arabinose 1-dehydrogenase-like Zn-dependent alcohol dehydrogenase